VIEGEKCIVLVYDTRYEQGSQYAPSARGEEYPFDVHVLSLKKTFHVAHAGLSFVNGCLDYVILPVISETELEYPDEG
jgi:hypothetical protein